MSSAGLRTHTGAALGGVALLLLVIVAIARSGGPNIRCSAGLS